MLDIKDIWITAMSTFLALIGGIASYLNENESLKGYALFKKAFIAVFVGILIGFICIHFGWSIIVAGGLAGLGGFFGVQTLVFLVRIVETKVGVKGDFKIKNKKK